jgi:hypothetical protein
MSQQPAEGSGPPEVIYVIRHGEKPADLPPAKTGKKSKKAKKQKPAPPFGIDLAGRKDSHGLLPLGHQRSGALTVLFDPARGPLQAGLRIPAALLSPSHGDPAETAAHRTYQTIQGLAGRLKVAIGTPFEVGQEAPLAASLVSGYSGVVLICWDHERIPALAEALPTAPGTVIPGRWPEDRFDVIWSFSLLSGQTAPRYAFSQVPQRLLSGDTDTVIPV